MTSSYTPMKDEFGNDMHLVPVDGVLLPVHPRVPDIGEQLRHVKNVELKPDDVLLVGFPKTGTHWVQEILYMLQTGSTEYDSLDTSRRIDFYRQPAGSNPPGSPPRVFTSHHRFRFLPSQVLEKGVKIVYLQRNPKDNWVSMFGQTHISAGPLYYGGTWDHFFRVMMTTGYWYGNWFDHALDWEREIATHGQRVPIYVLQYEQLSKNAAEEIRRLDQFLGHQRDRQFHQQVADACSFKEMKKAKDPSTPGYIFQSSSTGFYRKGQVGNWKHWFTVAQNEEFDQLYEHRMANSKFHFVFE